ACRAARTSATPAGQHPKAEHVAGSTEAGDHPERKIGDDRLPPLDFAPEHVGEVDLDEGDAHGEQGVAKRQTRVAVRGRVYERRVGPAAQRLHRVDELTLVVALTPVDQVQAGRRGLGANETLELVKRGPAVQLRFSIAQQIEIRTVQDRDAHSALETLEP